jgi:hypothetical protein
LVRPSPSIIAIAALAKDWDWLQEFINPEKYWTEKLQRRSELLEGYSADVTKCRAEIEQLKRPSSRQIWLQQKSLEGLSLAEAVSDYETTLRIRVTVCDDWERYMVPQTRRDLDIARSKLKALGR